MTWDLALQLALTVVSSTAVLLVYAPNHAARRWAPIAGLLGQPFWILAALRAEQWGILAVSLLYTYAWLRGAREQWRTAPATRDASHGESDEGKTVNISLGTRVRDTVTGFVGIVTARAEYLTGCTQYALTPPVDPVSGATRPSEWFDAQRLEVVDAGLKTPMSDTGGPQRDAAPSKPQH